MICVELVKVSMMSDLYFILLIQFCLAVLLIYSLFRQWVVRRREIKNQKDAPSSVERGETGWSYLYIAYGVFSIILTQIISVSESFKGHKVAIILADLTALIYLFFYNGWFRNKVIGLISKSKKLKEKF